MIDIEKEIDSINEIRETSNYFIQKSQEYAKMVYKFFLDFMITEKKKSLIVGGYIITYSDCKFPLSKDYYKDFFTIKSKSKKIIESVTYRKEDSSKWNTDLIFNIEDMEYVRDLIIQTKKIFDLDILKIQLEGFE